MLTQHGIMFNANANQVAKIHANQTAASQRKLPCFHVFCRRFSSILSSLV